MATWCTFHDRGAERLRLRSHTSLPLHRDLTPRASRLLAETLNRHGVVQEPPGEPRAWAIAAIGSAPDLVLTRKAGLAVDRKETGPLYQAFWFEGGRLIAAVMANDKDRNRMYEKAVVEGWERARVLEPSRYLRRSPPRSPNGPQ